MMHGTISPELRHPAADTLTPAGGRMGRWLYRWRAFLVVVVVPTLIVAAYYYLVAADQYESEAHFQVRSNEPEVPQIGGIGAVLGMAGSQSKAHEDALSVADYLGSHDAVQALQNQIALTSVFQRPEADFFGRYSASDQSSEKLLKFFHRQVEVGTTSDTGITFVRARTFRPADSVRIVDTMLKLGEQRVNSLNARSLEGALAASRRQLREAEADFNTAQVRLTAFRQGRSNIDPQGTGQAQVQLVSRMQAELAMARAQLSAMAAAISTGSPQYQALSAHVRSLATQVAAENSKLTSGENSIAAGLGDYTELQARQQFAGKRYEAAAAAVEEAREQARRQQLYLVRIVNPNMPQQALYPKRAKIVLTFFGTLVLLYALGWLIVAGMREHAS
jgi:capsular polysaccharide transport system permease protein